MGSFDEVTEEPVKEQSPAKVGERNPSHSSYGLDTCSMPDNHTVHLSVSQQEHFLWLCPAQSVPHFGCTFTWHWARSHMETVTFRAAMLWHVSDTAQSDTVLLNVLLFIQIVCLFLKIMNNCPDRNEHQAPTKQQLLILSHIVWFVKETVSGLDSARWVWKLLHVFLYDHLWMSCKLLQTTSTYVWL